MTRRKIPADVLEWFRKQGAKGGAIGGSKGGKAAAAQHDAGAEGRTSEESGRRPRGQACRTQAVAPVSALMFSGVILLSNPCCFRAWHTKLQNRYVV